MTDPNPVAASLAREIAARGPIGVDEFMGAALAAYYGTRDPLGTAGDFTTAPEISQIFGEILGLWCADRWLRLGRPHPVRLVELGPGRGTLMADILRALKVLPDCRAAAEVHLVETSPALRRRQRETLAARHPDKPVQWHGRVEDVPEGPLLLVANEFFDALPIRQWRRKGRGWVERRIDGDAGSFRFVDGKVEFPDSALPAKPPTAEEGEIFETCAPALDIAATIGRRLASAAGAALLIDYGHAASAPGETLQALRAHRFAPELEMPGEVDLTAHVDFQALGSALSAAGARIDPVVTQGRFLTENGALQRLGALQRGKDEPQAATLGIGLRRLIDPAQMGTLFKVLAAESPVFSR